MAVLLASSMPRAHAHRVGDGHAGGTLQMSDCSEDLDVRNVSMDSFLGVFVRHPQAAVNQSSSSSFSFHVSNHTSSV